MTCCGKHLPVCAFSPDLVSPFIQFLPRRDYQRSTVPRHELSACYPISHIDAILSSSTSTFNNRLRRKAPSASVVQGSIAHTQDASQYSERSVLDDLLRVLEIVRLANLIATERRDDIIRSQGNVRKFLSSCAQAYDCTDVSTEEQFALVTYPQVEERIRSLDVNTLVSLEETFRIRGSFTPLSEQPSASQHGSTHLAATSGEPSLDPLPLANLPLARWSKRIRSWEKTKNFSEEVWQEVAAALFLLKERRSLKPTQQLSIALVFLHMFRCALTCCVADVEQWINGFVSTTTKTSTLSAVLTTYASILGGDSVRTVLSLSTADQLQECDASLLLGVYTTQKKCKRKQTGNPETLALQFASKLTSRTAQLDCKQQKLLVKHFASPELQTNLAVQSMFDSIAALHLAAGDVGESCKLLRYFAKSFYFSREIESLCQNVEEACSGQEDTVLEVLSAFAAVRYRPSDAFLLDTESLLAVRVTSCTLQQLSDFVKAYSTLNYKPRAGLIESITSRVFADLVMAQEDDATGRMVPPQPVCVLMWHLACLWGLSERFFHQVQELLQAQRYVLHSLPVTLLYLSSTLLAAQAGSVEGPTLLRFGSGHMYDSSSLWSAQLSEYRQLTLPDEEESRMRNLLIQVLGPDGLAIDPGVDQLAAWTDFQCQVQSAVAAVTGELSYRLARVSWGSHHVPIPATAIITCRKTSNVAIFADGPGAFVANRAGLRTAPVAARDELLVMSGWLLVSLPQHEWPKDKQEQRQYLARRLEEHGVHYTKVPPT